ncbi:hypothetical protein T265_06595 [Opisthorchis viverrini]|uniref:Uncharacterized protein n=1 Tax=Opisthorchis viverrini TaxID=6198 RepID=A0A074ZRZ0_OPIVI|nr:hypothetical protein T265_06595 [Opisthorchis viverrini]KER26115.1 hypothetical protein T265_06595 [Opisthorchis viverrini]
MIISQTLPNMEGKTVTTTDTDKTEEPSDDTTDSSSEKTQRPISTAMPNGSSTEKPPSTLNAKPESSLQTLPSFQPYASTANKNTETHETVDNPTVTKIQESPPQTGMPDESSALPSTENAASSPTATPMSSSQTSTGMEDFLTIPTHTTNTDASEETSTGSTPVKSQSSSSADTQYLASTMPSTEYSTSALIATPESSLQTSPSFQSHASTATRHIEGHETVDNLKVTTLQESQLPIPTDMPNESSEQPGAEKAISTLTATPMSSSPTSASMDLYSNSPTHTTYTDEFEKNSTWSTPENSRSSGSRDMQIEILTLPYTGISASASTATPSTSSETSRNFQPHASTAIKNAETHEAVDNPTGTTIQEPPPQTDMPDESASLPSTEKSTSAVTATATSSSQTSASMQVYSTSPTHTTNTDASETNSMLSTSEKSQSSSSADTQYLASTMPSTEYFTSALIATPESSLQTSPSFQSHASTATRHTEGHETVDNLTVTTTQESHPPISTGMPNYNSAMLGTEKVTSALRATQTSSSPKSASTEVYSTSPNHTTNTGESEKNSTWSTEKSQSASSEDTQYKSPTVPSTQNASNTGNITKHYGMETSSSLEIYSTNLTEATTTTTTEPATTRTIPVITTTKHEREIPTTEATKTTTNKLVTTHKPKRRNTQERSHIPTESPDGISQTSASMNTNATSPSEDTKTDGSLESSVGTTIEKSQSPSSIATQTQRSQERGTEDLFSIQPKTQAGRPQTSLIINTKATSTTEDTKTSEPMESSVDTALGGSESPSSIITQTQSSPVLGTKDLFSTQPATQDGSSQSSFITETDATSPTMNTKTSEPVKSSVGTTPKESQSPRFTNIQTEYSTVPSTPHSSIIIPTMTPDSGLQTSLSMKTNATSPSVHTSILQTSLPPRCRRSGGSIYLPIVKLYTINLVTSCFHRLTNLL